MASSISEHLFQQVTIIGVGLLGGSLGLVLKEQGLAKTVVGIGRRQVNLELALQVGAIDRFASEPYEAVRDSDLIVLATPVDSYVSHVRRWGQHVPSGAIVSDVGSVKGQLVFDVEAALPPTACFVGAHPIAGKEKSGVAHATSKLFDGARCIVTPTPHTNADALKKIRCLWEKAGSTVLSMDPMVHDWVLGAVSHLPHIAAFSLMHALQDLQEKTPEALSLLDFSGGGLRDTTRIAASSPEMWRDICLANRENLLIMVDQYITQLQAFKQLLNEHDGSGLTQNIEQAKMLREGLP
ncbi:MAG: prephenate dehydrogenase/arogenate dehydrogenase family protein [Nitrospirota bacterium]|nr:MAG: prephenate dehydrogenase/arogenate dehydrogenase family protein [Nitrospirota bacterium]